MKTVIDSHIPFVGNRLDHLGPVCALDPSDITPEAVRDADILVVRTRTRCDARLLAGSKVRLVVTATIGTDHIDLDWCRDNGIRVANCAGCNAPGVAQYVWTALHRTGFDPGRDTLGVVGNGNVGSIVAEWGRRAGAHVLVCDPPQQEHSPVDGLHYSTMAGIAAQCSHITLHVPLTHGGPYATHHLMDAEAIASLRPGAVLINTSRGPVADNNAWSRAIAAGHIRGVADVWEGEPDILPALLDSVDYGTPHIAGYSYEGKQRATRMALEAVSRHTGIPIDTTGLEGPYVMPQGSLDPAAVAASYDIAADDRALRTRPGDFERLRSDYAFRHEYLKKP